VETYYDGQKLSWYIFTKTASADGKTLKEIIPAGASSGYFELKYEGKSVKATEPFTVTAPPQADLVITNVRSYSSTAGDTIIVDIKNAGTADLNNAKIHVLCVGHAIMRTNLNNIVPISSDEWIYITLNAGGVSWFFPYLILDFNLYTYPDVVCTAVLDGDPTPDNNVFGISIP